MPDKAISPFVPQAKLCGIDSLHMYDVDWSYDMRRTMQEILPGLYLGPYSSAVKSNLPALMEAGITHIICIRHSLEAGIVKAHFSDFICYLILDIADTINENILKFFPEANNFMENCLRSGGKCLVHGNAGISRSATIVMAFIMQKHNLSHIQAFKFVQRKRFCVGPNASFISQLSEFEPIYKAIISSEENTSRPKRKFNDMDSECHA